MKIKRIMAYIIDIFVVALISAMIFTLPLFKTDSESYMEFYDSFTDSFKTGGSTDISEEETNEILYQMSKETQTLNIINIGVTIIYFGVLAYIFNGKTIGKKIFKIQITSIEEKNLKPHTFMLRQIIVTNLIPKVLAILNTIIFAGETWLIYNNIISYLNYALYLLMLGFVIFRDDERGFHDVITNTKVIEAKK